MFWKWFFLFLQSRSVQCYDVVCCQNRRSKKALFPTFPLWQTRVSGPWWESMFVYNRGNFIGKLWTGTHYSGITASLLWLLSLQITGCSPLWTPSWCQTRASDETGSCALERRTHLGCQPELQTVNSKFRDSFGAPWLGCNDIWALVTSEEV